MQMLSIKEARAHLSALVDMAEKGETTVITRHGKTSARLEPMPATPSPLPNLTEFRANIAHPKGGLSETVIASRKEERF